MSIRKTIARMLTGSLALAVSGQAGAFITTSHRAFGQDQYALELDSTKCGWLRSVEGGHATADVVSEKVGANRLAGKHLGPVRYEPISIETGTGMCKAFYDWIEAGFTSPPKGPSRRSGAIVRVGLDGNILERMTFTNASILELGMPALDAASKDAAKMTLKFKPEVTRKEIKQSGKFSMGSAPKKWLVSKFKLKIAGLDDASAAVNKIEALTLKQNVTEPSQIEVPNLVITLPKSFKALNDWHQTMVVQGKSTSADEKTATLEYLDDGGKTLIKLDLKGLGVFKVAPDSTIESAATTPRRVKAEMYCEDIRFNFSGSWAP